MVGKAVGPAAGPTAEKEHQTNFVETAGLVADFFEDFVTF